MESSINLTPMSTELFIIVSDLSTAREWAEQSECIINIRWMDPLWGAIRDQDKTELDKDARSKTKSLHNILHSFDKLSYLLLHDATIIKNDWDSFNDCQLKSGWLLRWMKWWLKINARGVRKVLVFEVKWSCLDCLGSDVDAQHVCWLFCCCWTSSF